jgi:xanthine dehydrogenase accessory factor
MNNIYFLFLELKDKSSCSIATVIETHGSTPRKHGSSALFGAGRLLAGTIGGGVLEGRVRQIALDSAGKNVSGIYRFDLDNDISSSEEAICGGKTVVLIDGSPSKHLPAFDLMNESFSKKIKGTLVTIVSGTEGSALNIERYWLTAETLDDLPQKYAGFIKDTALEVLSSANPLNFKRSEFKADGKESLALFEPLFPSPDLFIAGAGHIGKALAHLGKLIDFEITVIDDRIEFANAKNIPDADHFIVGDIGNAIGELKIDNSSFVVIVTRGHNDDAKALRACINSNAAYIGMIGSKAKIGKIHREFVDEKWTTEEKWSAIHSPIGLEILSQTVEEIAVSIAAELVLVRNQKDKKV